MKRNKLYLFCSKYQPEIALFTSLGMVYGFLAGRAVLSICMFLFCVNGLWKSNWHDWLKQKWWLMGLAWTSIYVLSYFWSTDIPYWEERIQVKLPYLLFPLAFACLPPLPIKYIRYFSLGLIIIAFGACLYSLSFYFKNPEKIIEGYFYSKVFTTPAYKDHIRFSVFIAWVVIWCCYIFKFIHSRLLKALLLFCIGFFSIYLHLLAARSGLLVFYSFIFIYIIFIFIQKKLTTGLLFLACTGIACFSAYHTIPTFRSKIGYAYYELSEYRKGNLTADFSDIGRLISYKLATKIMLQHPVIGVGAGDIRQEMKLQYEKYSPNTAPEQRIVPHNQMITVMLAGGLLNLSLFLVWLFFPIVKLPQNRNGFYLFVVWFGLFAAMMVEPMLEVQFGVFVYLFCLLWMQKAVETIIPEDELK